MAVAGVLTENVESGPSRKSFRLNNNKAVRPNPPSMPPPAPSTKEVAPPVDSLGDESWVLELRDHAAEIGRTYLNEMDLDASWNSTEEKISQQQDKMVDYVEQEVQTCLQKHLQLQNEQSQLWQMIAFLKDRFDATELAARSSFQRGSCPAQGFPPASPQLRRFPMPLPPTFSPPPGLEVNAASRSFQSPLMNYRTAPHPLPMDLPQLPEAQEVCDDLKTPPTTPRRQDADESEHVLTKANTYGLSTPTTPSLRNLCASPMPSTPKTLRDLLRASPKQESPALHRCRRSSTPLPRTPGVCRSPMPSPSIARSPFVICENGGSIFGFTLRLASGAGLGLDFELQEGAGLLVKCIHKGGSIEAWNHQCVGGPAAGKAVMAGDVILKVNDCDDKPGMVREIQTKSLLRLTIARGEPGSYLDCLHPRRKNSYQVS